MSILLKSLVASLPTTKRGRYVKLGGDPRGKNFLYTNGNNVIIRDIENPAIVDIYSEHAREVNVAKYSPDGFYIASGDITGKVRIWNTVNKEHILKNENPVLSGEINDIDWSQDSRHIVVGGDGLEKFAAVFSIDSGETVGSLDAHTKIINACAFKPKRPLRIATGSDDFHICFFEGPPYKYKKSITIHTSFVNALQYSSDGRVFISGGGDGEAYVFNGINAELTGRLGAPKEKAHKASIYGLSFSPHGSQVVTVSGDKTAKIWDVSTMELVTEFLMGQGVLDIQLGCLWQGQHILTVSMSGFINYLDKNNPTAPHKIIKGHNKPITAAALSSDKGYIYTGSTDGVISVYEEVKGQGHSNGIQGIVMDGDVLASISLDGTLRETSTLSNEYSADSIKFESQPKGISRRNGISVVACYGHVVVLQGGRISSSTPVPYEPACVDIHTGLTDVAVGGADTLAIYGLTNGALSEKKSFKLENCNVGAVRYSPDGAFLAVVGSGRYLRRYDVSRDYTETFWFSAHTGPVSDVAWSPDSSHLATCSTDNRIAVWEADQLGSHHTAVVSDSHMWSFPNKIEWIDNNTLVSVGQDSLIKLWTIKY